MLKRKITERLNNWKTDLNRKPLVIKGVRQCGKTFTALEFARSNYSHVIYINFYENPEYASLFSGSLKVDDLIMYMSALLGTEAVFEEGQTIIILDEIQHCPNARTSLKFFKTDGRYDVIATGSLQTRRECPCFQTWDESPNQREMMLVFLSTKSNLGLDSVSTK